MPQLKSIGCDFKQKRKKQLYAPYQKGTTHTKTQSVKSKVMLTLIRRKLDINIKQCKF